MNFFREKCIKDDCHAVNRDSPSGGDLCTGALGTRQLRDYAAPHANAQAQVLAIGEGGPADQDDGHLMPADNRQTGGKGIQ